MKGHYLAKGALVRLKSNTEHNGLLVMYLGLQGGYEWVRSLENVGTSIKVGDQFVWFMEVNGVKGYTEE